MEQVAREALDMPTGDILASHAATVLRLNGYNRGITSLEGIQCFINLTRAFFGGNQITDLSPMAGLVALQDVRLERNPINDYTCPQPVLSELAACGVTVASDC